MIRILKRAVSTSRYYFVEERWTTNYMALVRYYATLESERGDAAASAAVELLSMIESEGFGDGVPPLQALLWCRESPRMRTLAERHGMLRGLVEVASLHRGLKVAKTAVHGHKRPQQ